MKKLKKLSSLFIALTIILAALPFASAAAPALVMGGNNSLSGSNEMEYSFTITQAGYYVLETYSTIKTDAADTILYLYDQGHNQIGMNDNTITTDASINTTFSTLQRYLEVGSYFVKVVDKNNENLNCFLRFDSLADTGVLNLNSNVKVSAAESNVYYKEYRFTVASSANIVIETSAATPGVRDVYLDLYDAQHNLIATHDDIDNTNANFHAKIERMLAGGDYYVRVGLHRFSNEILRCNLSISNSGNYAYITAPMNQGYILPGEYTTFSINAPKNAESAALTYLINGATVNVANAFYWDNMANCYKINANITANMFASPQKVNGAYPFPKFQVILTYANDIQAIGQIDGYITSLTRTQYSGMDQSWYYNDELDNSFEGFATRDYNCMAYALGVTDQWMWPWSVGYPDYEPIYRYFNKLGWENRPGYTYTVVSETPVEYPQLLFYSGHVAVVTKWDEEGNADEIVSKWGASELIRSNPKDGLRAYGEIMLWIKGRAA